MPIGRFVLGQLFLIALCALAGVGGARAQTGPVIVIPGKPGVPVLINGVVVDYSVVYGDWGLARPGQGSIIVEGPIALPEYYEAPGYFPRTGRRPRYGRLEIEPPPHPRGNTNYHREWSTGSDPTRPVTEYPPFDPPPVILAPRGRAR